MTREEALECARAVLKGQPQVGYVESARKLALYVMDVTPGAYPAGAAPMGPPGCPGSDAPHKFECSTHGASCPAIQAVEEVLHAHR